MWNVYPFLYRIVVPESLPETGVDMPKSPIDASTLIRIGTYTAEPIGKTAKGDLVYSLDCRDIPASTSGGEPQVAPTPPATVLPKAPESK
jgi:hypothetical protein